MKLQTIARTMLVVAPVALLAPFVALADTAPLTATCSGAASATSITWSASVSGGVSPVALQWGNGATTTTQVVTTTPGTYTMTLQATDASSTVATTSCSATVSSSTGSNSSVLAQIQALLAQIATLKQQILGLLGNPGNTNGNGNDGNASSTPAFNHGCPVLNRNLGIGSRGDDVKSVQELLSQEDGNFPSDDITGFFGPATSEAIARLQAANGVASTTTGTVGPLTREFLGRHCGEIEGEGHLKGTAKSWMDMHSASTTSSTTLHGQFNVQHGHGDGNGRDNGQGGSDN